MRGADKMDVGGSWLARYDIWVRYGGDPREFVVILTTDLQRLYEVAVEATQRSVQPSIYLPTKPVLRRSPWSDLWLAVGALFWIGLAVVVARC